MSTERSSSVLLAVFTACSRLLVVSSPFSCCSLVLRALAPPPLPASLVVALFGSRLSQLRARRRLDIPQATNLLAVPSATLRQAKVSLLFATTLRARGPRASPVGERFAYGSVSRNPESGRPVRFVPKSITRGNENLRDPRLQNACIYRPASPSPGSGRRARAPGANVALRALCQTVILPTLELVIGQTGWSREAKFSRRAETTTVRVTVGQLPAPLLPLRGHHSRSELIRTPVFRSHRADASMPPRKSVWVVVRSRFSETEYYSRACPQIRAKMSYVLQKNANEARLPRHRINSPGNQFQMDLLARRRCAISRRPEVILSALVSFGPDRPMA